MRAGLSAAAAAVASRQAFQLKSSPATLWPATSAALQVVSDPNGAFTRFLGMDQGAPDAPGARSLRYAAVVDDGVLLKVVSRWVCCGFAMSAMQALMQRMLGGCACGWVAWAHAPKKRRGCLGHMPGFHACTFKLAAALMRFACLLNPVVFWCSRAVRGQVASRSAAVERSLGCGRAEGNALAAGGCLSPHCIALAPSALRLCCVCAPQAPPLPIFVLP